MKKIRVKCPAKINLNLKVLGKRPDGFHNIESIMQTISLYDYLDICAEESGENIITLSGNSPQIPYNEHNLVYKAAELYLSEARLSNKKITINIEKNIPVAAGLAGGSTDAAGTLYGLNKIFKCFDNEKLHLLCAALGSDLNVCLMGGRILAKGRGEIIEPYKFEPFSVSLIKPLGLGISAKEAYTKFSYKIENNIDVERRSEFENDLEWAIIKDYPQLLK
ncbi:4-(cytidine 5'-diphospho)-2-C-methyl-D-erythritol kinase, partial [bacterium]|nr:4-(cytidine 5'-diphospho)-2-C-methyl-D-erythritol kinase [bacterium]